VESSFNPEAHSKAGAAGLWQFTRSTGRQYMQVDDVVDLRYDPYYAARAAAVFLQGNLEALGSWPMAITAYNHGRNGMLRAAREYDSYEQIFNSHESRLFRFASRNFYSEFVAAVNVARRLENDRNIILDRPEATIMVRIEGFARAEDRKPVLQGKKFIPKNLHVRIPANAQTRDLASAIPSRLYHSRQIRDQEYIVRRGDTAGSIARKYRISVAELVRANNLNRNAMIRIGQPLKIPSGASDNKNIHVVVLEPTSKIKPN
jgi:membrane-bound lytic murein transglycosylase D